MVDVAQPNPAARVQPERPNIPTPRRLRTAYSYFVKDKYREVARDLMVRRPQPIISRIGDMWRQLPAEQRQIYVVRETRDRLRYTQAKQEWARQHAGRPIGYLNKKRREKGEPRRNQSAYIFFRNEEAAKLRDEMRDVTARERDREIVRRWRALDEKIRDAYKKKADQDRIRYANDMHEYRNRLKQKLVAEQQRRLEELLQQGQQGQPPGQGQGEAPAAVPVVGNPQPPGQAPAIIAPPNMP